MKILILYGTETGNTEMLAEDMAKHVKAHDVRLQNLADTTDIIGYDLVAIFSSSYGEGEPPASAKPFVTSLETGKPDLSKVTFAMFGMGDKATYPDTFGGGSAYMSHLLTDLGAKQRGDHYVHDIGSLDFAEEIAADWLDNIIAGLA
jgi:MioC protein